MRIIVTLCMTTLGTLLLADAVSITSQPWLEYGALGLCSFMVMCNFIERRGMAKRLDENCDILKTVHEKTLAGMNRLSEALEDRPCLIGDQRIKDTRGKGG